MISDLCYGVLLTLNLNIGIEYHPHANFNVSSLFSLMVSP